MPISRSGRTNRPATAARSGDNHSLIADCVADLLARSDIERLAHRFRDDHSGPRIQAGCDEDVFHQAPIHDGMNFALGPVRRHLPAGRQGLGGDQQIVGTDHPAGPLEPGAQPAVEGIGGRLERSHLERVENPLELRRKA